MLRELGDIIMNGCKVCGRQAIIKDHLCWRCLEEKEKREKPKQIYCRYCGNFLDRCICDD